MPLVKMQAGALMDVLSKNELHEELRSLMQSWKTDNAVGARPITISADFAADATGLAVGGGVTPLTGGTLGPEPGFWWSVSRLAVRVDDRPAAFEVYLDRRSSQTLVKDVDGTSNGYVSFGSHELMVGNMSSLCIAAASINPGSRVYVSGAAIEIPNGLLWKWTTG